jgi:hypothetical protein
MTGRGDCCYFGGGDKQLWFDASVPLLRTALFAGRARHGAEIIQNPQVGFLYLRVIDPHIAPDQARP